MSVTWPTTVPGRVVQLLLGLIVTSAGIWLTIRANLGVASWEVLHIALAQRLGIGIGTASIAIGSLLVAIVAALGLFPGIGTILNVLVIGTCLNLLLATPVLASMGTASVAERLGVLVVGIAVFAIGCAIYVGAHLGSGPRDGLMLAIHLRLPLGVGGARVLSEGIGLVIGWSLGGPAGVGTLLFVVAAGPMVALAFRFLGLQPLAETRPVPRAP
ncbi:YczE/YyaS/YitT family protein [Nonomuraea basaltis]|uniref:YczE/YyaS/YitT family protein n=1 Tax=Nonomuraea basaltis TaxID=2495887 RepID=UPI00110C43B0|nr:hypothetical protein [Nonomuraea basaltis]TMR97693.1 hypothetical protein EJK15_16765 [Nonomuraea basaltis]